MDPHKGTDAMIRMSTLETPGLHFLKKKRLALQRQSMFAAIVLATLFCSVGHAEPGSPQPPDGPSLTAQNKALEADNARLKALLASDPCVIRSELSSLASTGAGSANSGLAKVEAATVFVLVDSPNLSLGSGFFVAPNIVVTNQHVVDGASKAYLISKSLPHILVGEVIAPTTEKGRDYALIKVNAPSGVVPLPLCATVKKTDRVGTWGYPGTISLEDPALLKLAAGDLTAAPEAIYSEGVVSVVRETTPPEILHTAVISHGNSGGPLVDDKGCVVGVNTLIHSDSESYRQTSVSLHAGDLVEYLRSQGIQITIIR
jgi:S1-C subfamily serine protease